MTRGKIVLLCGIVLCGLSSAATDNMQTKVEQLAKKYKEATSEKERRQICIDAMDDGVIHFYASVRVIDDIFATHFSSEIRPEARGEETDTGCVYFQQPQATLNPPSDGKWHTQTAPPRGWYLGFVYSSKNGAIQDYSISNCHHK